MRCGYCFSRNCIVGLHTVYLWKGLGIAIPMAHFSSDLLFESCFQLFLWKSKTSPASQLLISVVTLYLLFIFFYRTIVYKRHRTVWPLFIVQVY